MGQFLSSIHSSKPNDLSHFQQADSASPTSIDIVKLKLSSLGYDTHLKATDFHELAHILSDKEALLRSYLHTDFQKARVLQRHVERVVFEDDGTTISSVGSLVTSETRERSNSTRSTDTQDSEDDQNLAMIYDQLRSGSLRIKLIVAETSRNAMQRNLKRLISPFINMAMENPPEFGMFHIALAIGCWKIEWNNSSLCIPRAITGKSAIIAADIESIATPERLDDIREKLAEVIVRWNSTMYYQQNPPKDAVNRGNCQHFIDDILQALGLQATVKKFPKPLMQYLRVLRTQGMARMEFAMTKEFREEFGIEEKKVVFKTHEQLDQFFAALLEKNPNFQYDYKYEFYMLKSFDRAFWMRLQSNDTNVRNLRVYRPLYNEDESEMICPFGDPHTTSILKFQVKR